MFGKKIEVPKIVKMSKEEELGPKPADIPNTDPLLTFQILLRHSLPSIEVQAHTHDFGTEASCDKPRTGEWTNFYVKDGETWTDVRGHVETKYTDGSRDPFRATDVYRWQWVKHDKVRSVFSIRTDDVVMVVAKDNVAPVTEETLALELRAKPEPPVPTMRYEYQFDGPPPNSFIGTKDIEL